MIDLYQETFQQRFQHFARVFFICVYAKFRENKTLAKISEFTVINVY